MRTSEFAWLSVEDEDRAVAVDRAHGNQRASRLVVRAPPGRRLGASTRQHFGTCPDLGTWIQAEGSVNAKVAPDPLFGSAHIRPPWASMIDRLIASPMPMPFGFVV